MPLMVLIEIVFHFNMNYKSHFEMSNFLDDKGYDIYPIKENGMYRVTLWRNDGFIDYGKFLYETWQEAVETTTRDIYNKLNDL